MTKRVIRKSVVLTKLGISNSTLYAWIKAQRFPAPIRMGVNSVGWIEEEVDAWVSARQAARPSMAEAA